MIASTSTRLVAAASAALGLMTLAACNRTPDATEPVSAAATTCDRQCLIGVADTYVAALVAHVRSLCGCSFGK